MTGIGEVVPGDQVGDLIVEACSGEPNGPLADHDVVVVTQKIVSKAEGRLVEIDPNDPLSHKQLVEDRIGLDRVHDVRGLVHAEFLGDDFELGFQHLADPVLHRILKHEVDGTHHMALADTVHAAKPLDDTYRVPVDVVVDEVVAVLKVLAL